MILEKSPQKNHHIYICRVALSPRALRGRAERSWRVRGSTPGASAPPRTLLHLAPRAGMLIWLFAAGDAARSCPHFQKALLHAELSRERCAELSFSLGFMIVAAFMMTVVLLLLLFVFLARGVLQNLLALTPLRAVTFLSALVLMRARPCRACHRVVPLLCVRHRSTCIGSTHRIATHRVAAHRIATVRTRSLGMPSHRTGGNLIRGSASSPPPFPPPPPPFRKSVKNVEKRSKLAP